MNDPSLELYENKPEPASVGFLAPLVRRAFAELNLLAKISEICQILSSMRIMIVFCQA